MIHTSQLDLVLRSMHGNFQSMSLLAEPFDDLYPRWAIQLNYANGDEVGINGPMLCNDMAKQGYMMCLN